MQENDKPQLARLGLRFGVETVYMPELLKRQVELRVCYLHCPSANFMMMPPPAGRVAIDQVANVPDAYWLLLVIDVLEVVLCVLIWLNVLLCWFTAARGDVSKSRKMSLAGATREQMGQMLFELNCVVVGEEANEVRKSHRCRL